MNTNQITAFTTGSGGFFNASNVHEVIALVIVVLLIVYVAWLAIDAYSGFGSGEMSEKSFLITVARGTMVLTAVLFIITW